MLALAAPRRRGASLVEVGTGYGLLAERAARLGYRVVATDVDFESLRDLRRRTRGAGFSLDLVHADVLRGLREFDQVFFNPPYLPTPPAARDPDPRVNRALDGGPDGWEVSARFLSELLEHLRPGGEAWLLVSDRQSATRGRALAREWRQRGGRLRVAATTRLGNERLSLWQLTAPRPRRVRSGDSR